jgi:hypothetical protein
MFWLKLIQQSTNYAEIEKDISKDTLLNNNLNEKQYKYYS